MQQYLLPFILSIGTIFALPVEPPSAPKLIEKGFFIPCNPWGTLRVGYEGDFVANANMKQSSSSRVDNYTQETNSGTLTLNLFRRFDLYTLLGSSRTCADWRFSTTPNDTHRAQIESMYNLLVGVGARVLFYELGNASFGLGGRYERADYHNLWLSIDGNVQQGDHGFLHWRAWQIDLDVSYEIDLFSPYIGIKYLNAHTTLGSFQTPISNADTGSNQFESRIPIGLVIGCALSTGQYFMLNIEGRLIDEEAVTISGDIRF